MTGGVHVDTNDLRAKASQIAGIKYGDAPAAPVPPDALPFANTAVANLNVNANFLHSNQEYGQHEGARLAESLRNVASAYDKVDERTRAKLNGNGQPVEPEMPQGNSLPATEPPAPMGPAASADGGGYSDVEATQESLSSGDHGASLQGAAHQWERNAADLQTAASTFREPIQNWEGEAAQTAYQRFGAFGEYLAQLGTSWHQLADEAMRISDEHIKALLNHTPIYQNYAKLHDQMMSDTSRFADTHEVAAKMAALQAESDELRESYARAAAPQRIGAPEPPPSSAPQTLVTGNGTASGPGGGQASGNGAGSGSGGGAGAGGPQQPDRDNSLQVSPASAQQGGQGSGEGAGSGGGGSPSGSGGGSPSGGSSSGGGSGGGSPGKGDGAPDLPSMPEEPSLHAASAGGGAGGGAGSGGLPNSPLQGPGGVGGVGGGTSAGGGAGGAVHAAASAAGPGGAGGGMGGGMGGQHGGHGQGAGKEKRRTPGLSPDEELYIEDRDWTEGYIGKPQRKVGLQSKDA